VTIANGDNQLAIFDVAQRKVVEHFEIPGVGAINDASWGPSGEIALSGMRGGISDLYVLDPRTKRVRQLTNDRYADLQPTWSPDGRTLAFTTDRGPGTDFAQLTSGPMRLATIDVESMRIDLLPAFDGAKQINPQYAPDGASLFFISDRDGFSNIYRLSLADHTTRQVTRLATGVSGITELSPALTVAARSGRMVFSVFDNAGEVLYRLESAETEGAPLVALAVSGSAGILPPASARSSSRVIAYLADATTGLISADSLKVERLDRGLGLEYLGSPGVGVSFGGFGGTGVGGAVQAFWTDMLNNHVVGATLYSGGSLRDIGAETFYLNQRSRLHWGVGGSHVPYLVGAAAGIRDTTFSTGGGRVGGLVYEEQLARVYVDQASLITQYPLSSTRRIEAELSANRQRFEVQSIRNYVVGNQIVARDQSFDDALPALNYAQASLAYVGDYSAFGFTSPIAGGRYRFEASPMLGSLSMTSVLADYRRYIFLKPVTLAFRGMHYGRYGADAENSTWLQSMFIGYPSLVRGYSYESFSASECSPVAGNPSACPEFDRLLGSRIAVASAELRIPVLGPRQLALVPFNFLPVEVAPFVDAGEAWTRDEKPTLNFSTTGTGRIPVVSTGVSTRFNLFGAMVLEVYYAHPFQRPEKGGLWGFQLQPGW
jgi:hypothetical protein